MKKIFLSFLVFPLVVSNTSSADVSTKVESIVSGENASVKTEITNIVNQNVTHVESTKPGEIKVEVRNGGFQTESSLEASPTVIISELDEEQAEEVKSRVEKIKDRIFSFIDQLFTKLSRFFRFRP